MVNKLDISPGLAGEVGKAYQAAGVKVLALSAIKGEGLDALKAEMAGHITCFAGQSGVGKSTLIKGLTGANLETGDCSSNDPVGMVITQSYDLGFPMWRGDTILLTISSGFNEKSVVQVTGLI